MFFGWLGTLIGLIALTGGKYNNWGDINKMGPACSFIASYFLWLYNKTHYNVFF